MVISQKTTTQKYYFPWMLNLVREFVECCLEGQGMKRKKMVKKVQEFNIQYAIENGNHS